MRPLKRLCRLRHCDNCALSQKNIADKIKAIRAKLKNALNGLGSAVAEVLSEEAPCRMKRLGVPDRFGEVGTIPFLKEKYYMTEKDIEEAVKSLISKRDVA